MRNHNKEPDQRNDDDEKRQLQSLVDETRLKLKEAEEEKQLSLNKLEVLQVSRGASSSPLVAVFKVQG